MVRNTLGQKIGAQMTIAATGADFTGKVTCYVTVDAGKQAIGSVGAGVCTHEGLGYHTYAPSAAETNGDLLGFTFNAPGAVTATVQERTTTLSAVLGKPAGASFAADIAAIKAVLPAALTTAGHMKVAVQGFLDTALVEGAAGWIANAFKQFFNIATPAATMDHGILVETAFTLGVTPDISAQLTKALTTALPDSVPARGTTPSVQQALYVLYQFVTERKESGATVSVRKVDGSTLMTFTLDSPVPSPNSITRTT